MRPQKKIAIFENHNEPLVRVLLSVKETAFALNISPSLVRAYAGKLLPTTKLPHPTGIGFINRTLFDLDAVRAFAKKYATVLEKTR